MKTKIIPFDLETAKKIQKGKIKGKIIHNGHEIVILDYNSEKYPKGYPIRFVYLDKDEVGYVSYEGLHIEVLDDEPKESQFNSPCSIEQFDKLKEYIKQLMDVNQSVIDNLQNLRNDLKHIWDSNESSNFNSKTLFDKWNVIQDSLNKLFKDNALKNNVKISNSDLTHYAAEFFTWLRETGLIFNFQCDKLEELNQYAKEHIMDPSWGNEARCDIKQIFGIETPKREFKPFDKVLVRDGYTDIWRSRLYDKRSNTRDWHFCQDGQGYLQCIPYEGNEHLVGTTNKPREE